MIPDPVTASLARELPYPYDNVHEYLRIAAKSGYTPERAAEIARFCAQIGAPALPDGRRGWSMLR
jgi:hypothetical protein